MNKFDVDNLTLEQVREVYEKRIQILDVSGGSIHESYDIYEFETGNEESEWIEELYKEETWKSIKDIWNKLILINDKT